MRKPLLIFIFLLCFSTIKSQTFNWAKLVPYNTTATETGLATGNNGSFVVKTNHTSGSELVTFDNSGNEIWRLNFIGNITIAGMAFSKGGNLFITGSFSGTSNIGTETIQSSGQNDVFLINLSAAGGIIWKRTMGGPGADRGLSVCTDNSGNVILTGDYTTSATFESKTITSVGTSASFIGKYTADGVLVYVVSSAAKDSQTYSSGNIVKTDNSGNAYMIGYFQLDLYFDTLHVYIDNFYGGYYICKLDPEGKILYLHNAISGAIKIEDLAIDQSGNIEINVSHGWTNGIQANILKFSNNYSRLWGINIAGDYGSGVISNSLVLKEGNIFTVASAYGGYSFPGTSYLLIFKYNVEGKTIFIDSIPSKGVINPSVALNSNGEFIVCGMLNGGIKLGNDSLHSTEKKVFIAKFSDGNLIIGQQEYNPIQTAALHVLYNRENITASIELKNIKGNDTQIIFYNSMGQTSLQKTVPSNETFEADVSSLPKGVYFITATCAGSVYAKKIVLY
jgi:hypothetical protein